MPARLVVDASVTLAWLFPDFSSGYAESVLQALSHRRGLVPANWALETASAAALAERRHRVTPLTTARYFELLADLDLHQETVTLAESLVRVLPVAREFQISAHDAAYLELALRHEAPLATLDDSLRYAARRAGAELFGN